MMMTREELLQQALEGFLDGLDANCNERCGLSQSQWNTRLAEARKVLEKAACPTARDREAEIGRLHKTIDKVAAQLEGMADAEVEGNLQNGTVCRWLAGLLRSARTNGPKPGE